MEGGSAVGDSDGFSVVSEGYCGAGEASYHAGEHSVGDYGSVWSSDARWNEAVDVDGEAAGSESKGITDCSDADI